MKYLAWCEVALVSQSGAGFIFLSSTQCYSPWRVIEGCGEMARQPQRERKKKRREAAVNSVVE